MHLRLPFPVPLLLFLNSCALTFGIFDSIICCWLLFYIYYVCVCSQCVNIICGCVEPTCVGSLPVSIDMYVLIKLSTYIIFNANMITKNNNTQY